ncbi:MAG TPA: 1-acyl-sn-glycerol-3-phosphate acyltransferase [Pirellulaceae bacterium]|nr:1-acyl-sn-glycerol-3-phosphate acyltransferase [Pirellulaceae bacterium]
MSTVSKSSEQNQSVRGKSHLDGVLVIDERTELLGKVNYVLTADSRPVIVREVVTADDVLAFADRPHENSDFDIQTVVFSPLRTKQRARAPDVDYAKSVIEACKNLGIRRFVLISSAEVYGAEYSNSGLLLERETIPRKQSNRLADCWAAIEEIAAAAFGLGSGGLVILRPCWTLSAEKTDLASRLFAARVAFPAAGFDNSIQLLSLDDLAASVVAAIDAENSGIYNVAPDEVIPIRSALRMTSTWRIPFPFTILRWLSSARTRRQLDFIRYSWTVSGRKIKEELNFQPRKSSAEALAEFTAAQSGGQNRVDSADEVKDLVYDRFGMDEKYIRSCGVWQLGFVDKAYWRVEVDGLEHVPRDGGAILAGPHRGFMPFDGVMIVHLLSKRLGRAPRFLMHPALVKFPFIATFLTRLGGIIACQENADRVLMDGEMVGIFPEGIRGAFRMYDRGGTYRLGKFRDDYVKFALRHGVPIVPFVTVGPAETFPILRKIEWPWWKRLTHWPFFPITATWPLLPIPLPAKWHIKFLEPIATCDYGPDAAADRKLVSRLGREICEAMQTEIDNMLSRRKSIFYGSIFRAEPVLGGSLVERNPVAAGAESGMHETMDVA